MSRSAAFRSVAGGAVPFLAMLLLSSVATSARANEINASATCPAQATSGSQIEVQLAIENSETSELNARVLSSIVGNSGDNLAGIGVFGPRVAVPSVTLPAGTAGDDVYYYYVEPSVTNLVFNAAPAVPSSLAGTVATLLIVVEVRESGGKSSVGDVTECLVEVQ